MKSKFDSQGRNKCSTMIFDTSQFMLKRKYIVAIFFYFSSHRKIDAKIQVLKNRGFPYILVSISAVPKSADN